MIYKHAFAAVCIVAALGFTSCASIPKSSVYTPAQLRSMVQSGNYPRQGSPITKSESIGFSACISKIEAVVGSVSPNYPSRTIVNSNAMRMEKLWTNDAAMTFTCSAGDGKLIVTSAPYIIDAQRSTGQSSATDACVARGVAYFKEIGSYPTLSSLPDRGRRSEEVALERCRRSTSAFP